jgi:hypothetical protein
MPVSKFENNDSGLYYLNKDRNLNMMLLLLCRINAVGDEFSIRRIISPG